MIKNKKEMIGLSLTVGMCILVTTYFAHTAWTGWKLRKELDRVGIPATAVVQKCHGNRAGCSVTYQFEVTLSTEQIKNYTVNESYTCSDCQEGKQLVIKYLPQNPTKAGIDGRNNTGWYAFLSIGSIFLLFGGIKLYRDTLRNKSTR